MTREGEAPRDGRERALGPLSLLALGVNGVVGVGIFFAPSDIAARAPGGLGVLVFAATAMALAPVALAFAALGSRFDEDGGPVVYARAAFGVLPSYFVGWIAYVSALASSAAVMTGLVRAVLADHGASKSVERVAAVGLATALALLCASGLSLTARVWTALTVLKLLPLLAVLGFALATGARAPVSLPSELPAFAALAPAALTATFAFQGFEIVPVVAGQARVSSRAVPFAVLGALGIAGVLYVALQWACARALPDLARSEAPLAGAALVYGGEALARVVRAGTSVSALGIAVGMVAMTPRYLAALARGQLPFGLAEERRGVPLRALALTWVLVSALLLAGSRAELFALSSVAVLSQYVVTALSLLVLAWRRERGLTLARAWPAIPAALLGCVLASGATRREWLVAGAALLLGGVLRLFGARPSAATSPPSPPPPPSAP